MRTFVVAVALSAVLGVARAQAPAAEAACTARFDHEPSPPSAPLATPAELCATLALPASGQPWVCDVWRKLSPQLHVWRALDSVEGERFYLAARHKDGWHVGEAFFKTWITPGGGLSVRFEDWKRQPMATQELITLELRTKALDPDHGEVPAEMEETSSVTVLCVGDPKGAPRCLSFPTRRHGGWWDLARREDGKLERIGPQASPWHASVRYDVKRSGLLEVTKVAGEWATLQNDFAFDAGDPQALTACSTLRVQLWSTK